MQASSKVTDEYPENENVLQRVGEVSLYREVPKGNPTTQRRAPTNERVKSPLAQGGLPGQPSPTPKETRIWSLERRAGHLRIERDHIADLLSIIQHKMQELEGERDTWQRELQVKDQTRTRWEIAQIDETLEKLQLKHDHHTQELSKLTRTCWK